MKVKRDKSTGVGAQIDQGGMFRQCLSISLLIPRDTGTDLTVLALTDAEAVKRERRAMENFIFVHL